MYAEAYQRGQTRVVGFMAGRDPETPVPATPDWSALDVLRHLTGLSVDITNLVFEGFASDEWTERQVSARRHLSMREVIAEWDDIVGSAAVLLDTLDDLGLPDAIPSAFGTTRVTAIPGMAIGDILHHEFDLRNAYDDSDGRDLLDVQFSTAGHVKSLRRTFVALGLPTIRVDATDSGMGWDIGFGDPVASLSATSFELMRAVGGRRTRGEMLAMGWTGDPEPFVDHMVLPHLAMRESSLGE
ncbi:MAG: maleylpyruvate isomerase N-terminal domain-containing protein [Acidimicrobiia bacterium]